MTIDWGSRGQVVIITASEDDGLLVSVDESEPLACSGIVRLEVEGEDVVASCVLEISLQDALWKAAEDNFVLPLNPVAALWRRMRKDGFTPVGREFIREYNGTTFVGQQAQRPSADEESLENRVYFAKQGDWLNVHWNSRSVS